MKIYYTNGDQYYASIEGLIENEPTYVNNETGITLSFMEVTKKGAIEVMISSIYDLRKVDWTKPTKSIRNLNKMIAEYGLQFTDIKEAYKNW